MMKSFFKKLAFVMALAMVVTMAAPAAKVVSAAEDKALAIAYQKGAVITALNLVEVGDTEDLRFVYAPANWKELDVAWTSSNPNVVSVDANGVVKAEAAGTATVTVAVGTETASIEVYSVDTTTFTATMGNAENRAMTELELTVGDEFDFAFYGIKDYSVDYYRCDWFAVDPDGVLDFDETNGKLVAKKAGSAKISLGVMNLITGIKTDVAPCTVTVKEATPAVDPNNFEVTKMISDSKFELTFENKEITADAIKAGLKVDYYATGDVRVNYNSVKSVSVKDGVATVEFYYTVGDGVKYVFAINGIEKEYTTYIGKPASMKITWKDQTTDTPAAWAGYTSLFTPVIFNDKGTDITASVLNGNLGKVVEYQLVDAPATAQYWLNGAGIYFAQPYETAVVKAIFWDGYDTYGVRVNACECTTPITSTEKPLYDFPYQTPETATVHADWWNNVNTKFAVNDDLGDDGDGADYIWLKLKDTNGKTQEIKGGEPATLTRMSEDRQMGIITGQFTFQSDNMNIFTVGADGEVKANTAGTANILVYYDPNVNNYTTSDNHLVAVVPVTTYGTRYVANVAIDKNFATVSTLPGNNAWNEFNKVTFTVTLTDQLGDKINYKANESLTKAMLTVQNLTGEPGITVHKDLTPKANETGVYELQFEFANGSLNAGATRQLSYAIKFNNVAKQTFSINVVRPSDSTTIDASAYTVNINVADWHKDLNTTKYGPAHTATATLIAKRNGVDFEQLPIEGLVSDVANNITSAKLGGYYVKVIKDGVDVTAAKVNNVAANNVSADKWNVVTTLSEATRNVTLSNGTTVKVVDKSLGAGTYTVAVYKAVSYNQAASASALSMIAQNSVTIADNQPKVVSLVKKSHIVASADPIVMAQEAFEVVIGDKTLKVNDWKNCLVDAKYTQINAKTFFYHTITVYVPVGGVGSTDTSAYVPYTITVNDYVSIP